MFDLQFIDYLLPFCVGAQYCEINAIIVLIFFAVLFSGYKHGFWYFYMKKVCFEQHTYTHHSSPERKSGFSVKLYLLFSPDFPCPFHHHHLLFSFTNNMKSVFYSVAIKFNRFYFIFLNHGWPNGNRRNWKHNKTERADVL